MAIFSKSIVSALFFHSLVKLVHKFSFAFAATKFSSEIIEL